MSGEILLNDLCKICNNVPPKYCCPRCSSRTCSLTCYKRHKTWSSCSGKRDPATYMQRSQLATPAGIDHDYNFLSEVERAVDRADQDVERKGIKLDGGSKGLGVKLEQGLWESRVCIIKAPKGLSRERENRTVWNGVRNCIVWSVEWVLADGSKKVHSASEEASIGEGYEAAFATKPHHKRRKHNHEGRQRSEKPRQNDSSKAPMTESILATEEPNPVEPLQPIAADAQPASTNDTGDDGCESQETLIGLSKHTPDFGQASKRHFYLHIPNAPSKSRVVAPISSTTTIRTALWGRTVHEFPTIHVLHESQEQLAEPFLIEADWKRSNRGIVEAVMTTDGKEEEEKVDSAEAVEGRARKISEVGSEEVVAAPSKVIQGA